MEYVSNGLQRAEAIKIQMFDEERPNQISEIDDKIDDICTLVPQRVKRVRTMLRKPRGLW